MQLTRLSLLDQASNCPALLLPPELWIYILRFFERKRSPFNQRQLYHVALVSSFFWEIALPLLYSQLAIITYHPSTIPITHNVRISAPTRSPTIPVPTALTTVIKRRNLHSAVKSIELIGHIDIVVLSRRTSTRTSEIIEADELRDLLTSTLPHLTNLRSITFNAVSLTSTLSTALFYLPYLEHLILIDCRVPVPPNSIFHERPMDNKLTDVELSFGSWSHTPAELEFISAFIYGPKLKRLVTGQSQFLLCLLHHGSFAKLQHLKLRRFTERDAGVVAVFLRDQTCVELKTLDLEDCQFPQWTQESTRVPIPPRLQTYTGSHKLARLFASPLSRVRHISLWDFVENDEIDGPELGWLATVRGIKSLELYMFRSQLVDSAVWAMFRHSFATLRELRIRHGASVEILQHVVLPMCLDTLPSMTSLEKLALLPTAPLSDCGWHTSAVRDLARRQPALREIAVSLKHVWLRLAKTEWKEIGPD